jgi:hypothetical protein
VGRKILRGRRAQEARQRQRRAQHRLSHDVSLGHLCGEFAGRLAPEATAVKARLAAPVQAAYELFA